VPQHVSTALLLAALVAQPAAAQWVHTLASPNEQTDGWFGYAVAGAGDINGDGHDDVIVGAWDSPGASPDSSGRAYVFSGASMETLRTLVSPNEEYKGLFGASVAGAGDVNSDGCPDVIVGAWLENPGSAPVDAGRAYVFSGATGGVLHTLASPNEQTSSYFSRCVGGIGDVDGDGFRDLVVGAPWECPGSSPDKAGRAHVFSGATGAPIHTLTSPNEESGGRFGQCVSAVDDLNADGREDVVVGAYMEDPGASPDHAGRAYVFSGATGSLLRTLVSPNEESAGRFGFWLSGIGDVDSDSCGDILVGAYGEGPTPGLEKAGRAYVFSGGTGEIIWTLVSPEEELWGFFGRAVCGAGDVDGDGCDDVIVGAFKEDPGASPDAAGRAYVFSGSTGALLLSLSSPSEEEQGEFGYYVSAAGDANSDGRDDVIVGAYKEDPGSSPADAGRAYVFTHAIALGGEVVAGDLALQWTPYPGTSAYWVYGASSSAYFEPGPAPGYAHRLAVLPAFTTAWVTPLGVGDPDSNWTYLIMAVSSGEQELRCSNRFGEFDFENGN
jgi:hypothetical protein